MRITLRFDERSLARTRHVLRRAARAHGLDGIRLDDFLLAADECVVNAVRHGGGGGRVVLWCADGVLRCEISDQGPGIPERVLAGTSLPSSAAPGGRGIWLTRRLADEAEFVTGPGGTVVRLAMRVSPPSRPGPVEAARPSPSRA
ncbi:ATP-binding protein [Nonomuraea sp. MCN248]|uniref:ATP-binding protein n=1 Tax=Nonomuraea corallina TaxID=2989783 RepID=A0ABT4S4C3_9ACTN|nr:ATP-binding protein [Nonomuraea corallina]MDA0632062.1 ATP-binding protein [Nonomuraea corallina]